MSFSSRTNNGYYSDEIDTNNNANIIKEGEAKKDIEDVVTKVKAVEQLSQRRFLIQTKI